MSRTSFGRRRERKLRKAVTKLTETTQQLAEKTVEVLSKTNIETEVRRQVKDEQSDSMTTADIILFLNLQVTITHANE